MKSVGATSVLILDGDSNQAYSVLQCLGRVPRLRTHILSQVRDVPSRFSRYCASFHLRPTNTVWEHGLFEAIEKVTATVQIDVLVPAAINATLFIRNHSSRLRRLGALHPVANADAIALCRDKWLFAQFATKHGIPIPQTILFTGQAREDLGLFDPGNSLLLKPRVSSNGRGILPFSDRAQAELFLDAHSELAGQFIAQPRLDGSDFGCSVLCLDGSIVAYTIQKSVYRSNSPFGTAAGIELVENDEILDISRRLLCALRWNGVANIDFRYDDRERRIKVFELNSRYWGTLLGSLYGGVNFPHLSCMAALGETVDAPKYRRIRYFTAWGLAHQWLDALRRTDWPPHSPAASVFRYICADPRPYAMLPFIQPLAPP